VHETFVQLVLPHTPLTFAPHALPVGHVVPQSVEPPQPSPIVPQYETPDAPQAVLGEQFGDRQMCFVVSQVSPMAQPPQSSGWPQPSPTVPQYFTPPTVQLAGMQFALPQRLATPEPPHVSGAEQSSPQSTEAPQPSPILPQYVPPFTEQLVTDGMQAGSPQMPGTNAPQVWFAGQSAQSSVPPQPSPILPQYCAVAVMHVSGVHVPASLVGVGG
jgi:hypothetical protein